MPNTQKTTSRREIKKTYLLFQSKIARYDEMISEYLGEISEYGKTVERLRGEIGKIYYSKLLYYLFYTYSYVFLLALHLIGGEKKQRKETCILEMMFK